jgi:hypothetical protein
MVMGRECRVLGWAAWGLKVRVCVLVRLRRGGEGRCLERIFM